MAEEDLFKKLFSVNVNEHTEKIKGTNGKEFTYLSWSWAWAEFKSLCPDATYEIKRNPQTDQHYWFDPNLGYEVRTSVTAGGKTYEMWLPVMDGANQAMKATPYAYRVKNKNHRWATKAADGKYYDKYGKEQPEYIEKEVAAATMFDINTAIMRCLVKNLAMFGFGLYIYSGEDLPYADKEESKENPKEADAPAQNVQPIAQAKVESATQGQIQTIARLCNTTSQKKPGKFDENAFYKKWKTTKESCSKELAYKIIDWFKTQYPDLEVGA